MKKILLFLSVCFFLFIYETIAQNAPVTTTPVKTVCPGSAVSVPVTVTGFHNIGAISLTMNYDPAVLTYISSVNSSGFPGLFINGATSGSVIIGGFSSSSSGINYPDNTILFTINFNYIGGTTALTWFDNGASCEYSGPAPDFFPLNDLPYATYYINGQVAPVIGVDFTADNLFPAVNQAVVFSDLTTGGPTSWNWTITPGTFIYLKGTNSGSQNPHVQFTSKGAYTVSLAATKGSCTITKTKTDFIHCGTNGLWTGITSTDWNIPSNWDNYMVPDSSTDVMIPASCANWPVYTGNLVMGVQCKTLTLESSSSMMTVTGNIVITP